MPTVYNKVTLNNTTLIDLSGDTVASSDDIVAGKVGHLNDGTQVTGTAQTGGSTAKTVNISLAYPSSPSCFQSFTIYETTNGVKGQQIGSISSATGSTTVTVSAEANGIRCDLTSSGWIVFSYDALLNSCRGGVGLNDFNDNRSDANCTFVVAYDGNIGLDFIEWDD